MMGRWVRSIAIYKCVLLVLLCISSAPAALAAERILSFDAHITVNADGSLRVRETLKVRAEGENLRHGIFRDFPTTYPRLSGGGTVVVGFLFDSASRNGEPEPWRVVPRENGVRIYIGSKSVKLPAGEHVYELVYRTDRQLGYFADHDEIYWNATGNGWVFPIDEATATIQLPEGIPRDQVKLEAYTGAFGDQGRDYAAEMRDGSAFFRTTRPLRRQEGLTIVASWPKGHVQPGIEVPFPASGPMTSPGYSMVRDAGEVPGGWSPLEKMLKRPLPRNQNAFYFVLGGFLALIGYYYFIWNRVGRDPPGRVIIPEYQPPPQQSPASMRYILRMSYDNECFGAAVLSLAVKGYLRIEETPGTFGFGRTYTLICTTPQPAPPLSEDELALYKKLFAAGESLVLKQENHAIVGGARSAHDASLKSRYASSFFRVNGGWHALGIVISLLVVATLFVMPGSLEPWPRWQLTTPLGWASGLLAIAGLVANGLFGWLLKAPTPRGQVAMDHIRGFKMYLEVAEGEELKRVAGPPPPLTPQLFESYLPAALALDVEQKWSERFARVLDVQAPDYRPAWYSGPGFRVAQLGAFSSGLSSSLTSAISASSTPPGSKSGGGGRGSSGGGGGGGGGGGW